MDGGPAGGYSRGLGHGVGKGILGLPVVRDPRIEGRRFPGLFRPAPAERLDSDGEAPLEAWLAFARPESVRPEAHAADLPPMPVARPVIYGRRAADR